MKKLLLSVVMLAASLGYGQGFTVKIKVKNPGNYRFRMAYNQEGRLLIDSNMVTEGDWRVFKGKVDQPVVASLSMPGNPAAFIQVAGGVIPGPRLNFFLTNEVIEITGDADSLYTAKVNGGKANEEWGTIKEQEVLLESVSWQVTKAYYANPSDTALGVKSGRLYLEKIGKQVSLQREFVAAHPNSLVSPYFLSGMINRVSFEDLKAAFDKLALEVKESYYGKSMQATLRKMGETSVGKTAVPVKKTDINGNIVSLATLKGKYVLLDFWGSWCGPCRSSHPHLKELYGKYKDKGFEILGIAEEHGRTPEESRNSWKRAVEQDGMTWLQVLNNEGKDTFDAVDAYAVSAFPTKVLLDKEGRVIARYVGDSRDVDEKLKTIFGF